MILQINRNQVDIIEAESKKLSGSLAQVLYLLKLQAELILTLQPEEIEKLNKFFTDKLHVQADLLDQKDKVTVDQKDPDYLTTLEVAGMLGITPQMVRKRCLDQSIPAWRTLGDRGEWRIETDIFKNHPRYPDVLKQRLESSLRNQELFENIKTVSQDPEYGKMMDAIQKERDKERDET